MMVLWATAGVPLGVYNIVEGFNLALQVQPQILTALSLVTWGQCMYYGKGWGRGKVVAWVVAAGVGMGGVEAGLVWALLEGEGGEVWPATLMAVLAAVLLCAGVGRHYWDIYRMRTVRGISFWFVGIDALGDLTSLLSVLFEPRLDVLGMVIYASELVLWMGVLACGGYYNLRPWVERFRRERREDAGEGGGGGGEGGRSTGLEGAGLERSPSQTSSTVFRTASLRVDHETGEGDHG